MSERDINQNASMELFAKALLGQTRYAGVGHLAAGRLGVSRLAVPARQARIRPPRPQPPPRPRPAGPAPSPKRTTRVP